MSLLKSLIINAILILFLLMFACNSPKEKSWKPADNALYTRWVETMDPDNILPQYPRPQMVRSEWLNLNGLWNYAILPKEVGMVTKFDGKILVPFPLESALSGVKKSINENSRLWYRKTVEIPSDWLQRRILLNFGAVDWETIVWINGKKIGTHRGGYDAFSFDITCALKDKGPQEIVLAVWDPTEDGHQPRGKQTRDPEGFWYTAVTGIWQTVWLEPVSKNFAYFDDIKLTPDIDQQRLTLSPVLSHQLTGSSITARILDAGNEIGLYSGSVKGDIVLKMENASLWSPENPFLYDIEVLLYQGDKIVDKITSYFGMRKISKKKDDSGVWRLALNNEIYFQFGLLDQGWWPDGLYRAPSDEALRYDIEVAKKLGFNMLRKHGKMEPQRWYYWCDKLGILVWQDMTPGDIQGEYGTKRTAESARQFELEYREMIDELYNFPSLVTWVIFNEGWGQYDTKRLVEMTKEQDATRMVIGASGFVDQGTVDIHDIHAYPGPAGAALSKTRVTTLGEFGGLGFPVKNHLWNESKAWGYISYQNTQDLTTAYESLLRKLHPYVAQGISAAIYTQLSDVENETNGMMTYDREVIKMDTDRVAKSAGDLYAIRSSSFSIKDIIPTSQEKQQSWIFTLSKPDDGWEQLDFEDTGWQTGTGGFGDPKDTNPVIGTVWTNRELWLRKEFNFIESLDSPLYLKLYHQFEMVSHIYLNGKLIAEGPEYSNAYTLIELDSKTKSLLKTGENILAIYCKNNGRRAYFDCGLVKIIKSD